MLNKNDLSQEQIDKALICFKNAKYKESIDILKNLEKKQSHFLIYWYLGHSYFRIYDYNSAINNIKKSINLKKPDVLNLSFLAEIYLRTNNYVESIKLFKKVLDIDNKNVNSLFNLAKSHLEIGQVEIAETYYNNLIKEDPTNLEAHYELIRINKNYLTTTLIEKIKSNEIPNDENSLNNIFSKFILAEYYKNTKNFKNEIKCLIDAHNNYSIKKDKSSKQEFNYFINLLPKFISKVKETNVKLECDLKPIFVMGLPRSGTTLIENIILSSNDKIDNGGEAGVFSKVFFSENIIADYEKEDLFLNFDFKKKNFESLKKSILNQYNQMGINFSNKLFTDKSLENFLYIDLIKKIFPNAKFIYCKRDKYANFLGILKVFLPNLLWTHSIEKIIQIMNLYEKKHNEIINENQIQIKVIELEKLSNNPEIVLKDLFNFLDLEWDKKFLNKYMTNKNIIQTVSNLQVRQKISKHDLSYLDKYIPLLKDYKIENLI